MGPRNGWALIELSDDRLHVLGRSEEQAVVVPEWSGVGPLDRVEQVRLRAETRGERGGSLLAQFRRLTVDDHDDIGTVCGNAVLNAVSRTRQGSLGDNSAEVSVVMAKWLMT